MGIFLIAEAGVNHNGSIELAKKLIDAAAAAGADAVKFQTFIPEEVISEGAAKAEYQKQTTGAEESQLDMVRKLCLSFEEFDELMRYCDERGIMFLSTPFDLPSLAYLMRRGMPVIKVPSGEVTNLPLLSAVAKTGKPVILSTGMCAIEEIAFARELLLKEGCPELTLLHCNTSYPTPFEDANLRAMQTLREHFGGTVGFSDHTLGIACPIAAAALGAQVIEKHFTLDRTMEGPDHAASLEPDELKAMVEGVRAVELALGDGVKAPRASELPNRDIARKSIVAARPIKMGEILDETNLAVKRPGDGISPMRWYEVIGRAADRDYAADAQIVLQ